ncbi:unnamed protein product [Cladocopium goreaui]|uniref:Uncharacterized protein n=1 Tax=Cladocopium goreaui TaxID=2562237 RepID=A0A9P1C5J2_9DINO|nr:unnamed protein product [Cladocopium goreaui]|mmetsp:Transcript_81009/g.165009  ORF Transcript_81009/g.165009 Transcript_81009/m.165009 type:complete len:146 (+) Transcript_81009:2-439(+)
MGCGATTGVISTGESAGQVPDQMEPPKIRPVAPRRIQPPPAQGKAPPMQPLPLHPLVPVGPVGAVDVADPDDPLLMTPVASWKGRRSQMQLPYGVPLAPDRQSHEEHLVRLSFFRKEVTHAPTVISTVVDIKRDDHEQLLGVLPF